MIIARTSARATAGAITLLTAEETVSSKTPMAIARTAADTNWSLIADLYELLAELIPSDVVRLNLAVAVGMAQGPAAGLDKVDALADAGALDGYYLLPATRADFLRRLGRNEEAASAYEEAAALAVTGPESRSRSILFCST